MNRRSFIICLLALLPWYLSAATLQQIAVVSNHPRLAAGQVSENLTNGNIVLYSDDLHKTDNNWHLHGVNAWGADDSGNAGAGSFYHTSRTLDPLGANNASFVQQGTDTGEEYITSNGFTGLTAGRWFHFSVFAKAAGCNWLSFHVTGFTELPTCFFDLSTGRIGYCDYWLLPSITDMGNGWYLCDAYGLAALTSSSLRMRLAVSDNVLATTTANNTDGLYLWGPSVRDQAWSWNYVETDSALSTNGPITKAVSKPVGWNTDDSSVTGLLDHWVFDENGGLVAYDTATNHINVPLTLTTPPVWTTGHSGTGITRQSGGNMCYINPSTSYLDFADTTFSVSLWVKMAGTSSPATTSKLVARGNTALGGWWVGLDWTGDTDEHASAGFGNSGTRFVSTTATYADGNWHHLVAIMTTSTTDANACTIAMYVDGSSVAGTLTQSNVYSVSTNKKFGFLGDSNGGYGYPILDGVRIYDHALTTDEITILYNAGQ